MSKRSSLSPTATLRTSVPSHLLHAMLGSIISMIGGMARGSMV